jgi:hypothetical protein
VNDAVLAIPGAPALLVAHDLKLFPLLAAGSRTLAEVVAELGLARRPAETLLAVGASLGLVRIDGGRYALTPLAEDYLLEESPAYFGSYLDFYIANAATYSFEQVKQEVLTDAPQGYDGAELSTMLTEAGFVEVAVKPTFGYWSVATGRKPVV